MSQHDFIISDGPGATVRSDINAALQALASTSKDNSRPTTPYAGQLWLDDNTPSSTVWTLYCYDGTDDIKLGEIDSTNNRFNVATSQSADVASASTIDLDAAYGMVVDVTGTTTITAVTLAQGRVRIVRFTGALTFTHGSSLVLPGAANITTVAGDYAILVGYASSVVRCAGYFRAAANGTTLATPQNSTSGTSLDFTSIPSGVRRITVCFAGVSTSGSDAILIQLGDSGGIETSGYLGTGMRIGSSATAESTFTNGFAINHGGGTAIVLHGSVILTLLDASTNTWVAQGVLTRSDSAAAELTSGSKSTSAVLDRVRITTVSGTDTFDAGKINIAYEY